MPPPIREMGVAQTPPVRIALVITGGTIAMTTGDHGADLIEPSDPLGPTKMSGITVDTVSPFTHPSCDITLADVALLAQTIADVAATVDAVVVTHGTDTLEETAFALALLAPTDKPIVLTGAMRAGDRPGADGPANLNAACRVAASSAAVGKGVLVVIGDEVHSALFARKVHTSRPHAFGSTPFGPLGWVVEDRVCIALTPIVPRALRYGSAPSVVPVIEAHSGFEGAIVAALDRDAIAGLVLSLPGGGHVASAAVEALADLARHIPVVIASRTGGGELLRSSYGYAGGDIDLRARGFIGSGYLGAIKARTALALLLSSAADRQDIEAFFNDFRGF